MKLTLLLIDRLFIRQTAPILCLTAATSPENITLIALFFYQAVMSINV
ncbi:MAG: hypothetical protein IJ806_11935 [Ruminococcus sp.]|nr:hypothetical protein [Ruminococcus sp.]